MLENHFISLTDYYERDERKKDDGFCWKCNKYLPPLTLLDPESCEYYLPCWNCIGSRKYEKVQAIQTTQNAIHDYYDWILGDRYFQMFIIDDIYIKTTTTHEFGEFKKVLKLLQPKDRNKLWLIDYIAGYPKLICEENIEGLKIVGIDTQFKTVSKGSTLVMKDYELMYPEIIPYDTRHHSRYNIYNTADNRKTKRLRLSGQDGKSSNKCIKFFNYAGNENIKSLFGIRRFSTGEDVDPASLDYPDYTVLKLVLMRNKVFTKILIDMLEEFSRSVGVLRDSVFLKNTVTINPWNDLKVNVSWLPEYKEGYINISIL
jgi:hypothetical protein